MEMTKEEIVDTLSLISTEVIEVINANTRLLRGKAPDGEVAAIARRALAATVGHLAIHWTSSAVESRAFLDTFINEAESYRAKGFKSNE